MIFRAAVLGIVQGLTEFIPVSSSGHLIAIPELFGWPDFGLSFDVALHMGTLVALLIFFRKEWLRLLVAFFDSLRRRPSAWGSDHRLAWYLILGTIPAGIAGLLLEMYADDALRQLWVVVVALCLGSILMMAAERWGGRKREFGDIRAKDALVIGVAQACALVPGTSRSGATISAGMLLRMKRESAARFAFMLATPIIAGAGLYELVKLSREGMPGSMAGVFTVGFVTSGIVGLMTIRFLLKYLEKRSLYPFVWYRFAFAGLLVVYLAIH